MRLQIHYLNYGPLNKKWHFINIHSFFLIAGLVGLAAACGIGAYKFKHRGTMSTSVFLMQLRVAAQGTVVACLTTGIVYHMAQEYLFNTPEASPKKE